MEILDQTGWLWGLSLIVLTMAIHATAVVMLAFAGGRTSSADPGGNFVARPPTTRRSSENVKARLPT